MLTQVPDLISTNKSSNIYLEFIYRAKVELSRGAWHHTYNVVVDVPSIEKTLVASEQLGKDWHLEPELLLDQELSQALPFHQHPSLHLH